MKKSVIAILLIVVAGLLIVGCPGTTGGDSSGGDNTGGGSGGNGSGGGSTGGGSTGSGDTGIDLENAYINTSLDENYEQWFVSGNTYTEQSFRDNVKRSESVYTFTTATDFIGDIYVQYWDEVIDSDEYTKTPLNTDAYTLYKGSIQSAGEVQNGAWIDFGSGGETFFFCIKGDTTLQIVPVRNLYEPGYDHNDYYIPGYNKNSTLNEIMGRSIFKGSNGTYSDSVTNTSGIRISGSTFTYQVSSNGVKDTEMIIELNTKSTSPTVYGVDNDSSDNPILGTTPITATGYTLYQLTYTKYEELINGGWVNVLERIPADELPMYIIYKIEGNSLSFVDSDIISKDGKYYIYTDDINNPVLNPDIYTKQ